MSTGSRFYPNLYKDSVSLMTVSAQVTAIPGIEAASVVMASATNVDNLAQAGLGTFEVRPNDLVVAVSGKYQGRVMTSAVAPDAASLGWIHRRFIEEGKTGTQFDNYGGEDRFWLGPEGGQFGLYFPAGKPFEFDHWQTPAAFQEGEWETVEKSERRIVFRRAIRW